MLCIKWGPTLCRSDPTKRSPKGEARRHSNNLIDIWESKDLGPYQTHYPIKMGAGCQKKTWQPDAQTIREMLTNDGCKRNNILTSPRIPLQNRSYAQTMTVARRKQHATKKFKTLLWRSPSPSWAIKLLLNIFSFFAYFPMESSGVCCPCTGLVDPAICKPVHLETTQVT